ncbi:MAG: hypothetical protein WCL71_08830 [Deltaproteobacteria bacterium]
MNSLSNNKGIALVTSLMLTLISLTIVMYLLYMVTSGVKMSGATKRYKTALEASYGGTDLIAKEIIPTIFNITIASGLANPTSSIGNLYPAAMNFITSSDACLMDKLTKSSSQWAAACSKTNDPKSSPDFRINLSATSSTDSFTVYTKIVESICSDKRAYPTGKCTGSDLSGMDMLEGGQGTTAGSSGVTVQSMPATYRIEIQGERSTNPMEKSKLSILYAY